MTLNPQYTNTKPGTAHTKTSTLRIAKSLTSILGLSDKKTCTPFLLSYSSKFSNKIVIECQHSIVRVYRK